MTHGPDKQLLYVTGIIAILGVFACLVGNVIGSMIVPDHNWVADTISDLAAGEYEIIQDVALYGFASAVMACALGAAHLHQDGVRWNIGILSLAIVAVCVVIIGARNEYGDQDNDGVVIHVYVVYALGFFFSAAMFLMARGLGHVQGIYKTLSYLMGILWVLGAPIFFVMPTGYDGAYERGLGLVISAWVLVFAWVLITVARGQSADGNRDVH